MTKSIAHSSQFRRSLASAKLTPLRSLLSAAAVGALGAWLLAAPQVSAHAAHTVHTVRWARTFSVSKPLTLSSLQLGVVLTEHSADPWNPAGAVARAQSVVRQSATYQCVPIMGWGTLNPEPSPGAYDWSTLDMRLNEVRQTGGIPVIDLCGAPDWMKGGSPGETDWSRLEVAPLPPHYRDFADLAVAIARRYPFVHYFEVWNEFKGFYDAKSNNWDVKHYTQLYNAVADALAAYDSTLQVGGPYAPVDIWGADPTAGGYPSSLVGPWGIVDRRALDAVSYWLRHAHHPAFVCVDGGLLGKDNAGQTSPFAATGYFTAVNRWLRSQTALPIWWSEWYTSTTTIGPRTPRAWVALTTASLFQLSASRASVALLWDPEQYPGSSTPGLWTSTAASSGGDSTPLALVFECFKQHFPSGTRVELVRPLSGVVALVSGSDYMAVNATNRSQTATIDATTFTLTPYQVASGKTLPPGSGQAYWHWPKP